jgi:23S rRNA (cytidine1920-2'-O)/16S rRNA (cytidine1409-2'-O)-methyltransferase
VSAKPRRVRLDVAVVEQGLESSRERARRSILAGEVIVNGQIVRAPSTLVPADAVLAIGATMPYVSRGGLKLAHALDRFGVDPAGRVCFDAGASTGGFTDVLLQRGAARVYAADVGKGLLDWKLRQNPRVVVMEEVNVRYLRLADSGDASHVESQHSAEHSGEPTNLQHSSRRPEGGEGPAPRSADAGTRGQASDGGPALPEPVSLAVVDVAFISLRLVLPAINRVLTPDGEVVALVKPQFEAGRADVRKGVVRDPRVHRRVLQGALDAARENGLHPAGLTASPIRGQAGNVEFLLWARRSPVAAWDDSSAVSAALAEALALSS